MIRTNKGIRNGEQVKLYRNKVAKTRSKDVVVNVFL